jgi:DNA-binding transcriptional LysR family regulator
MVNGIDLTRVDLNLLVVFEAVFEQGNVGAAAARLHVTSSAVSHGLGRLRQLFDDPLFLRTPKGVVPTARGLELAPPIAEILTRVRGVVGSVERFDPKTSSRRFTIGAPDALTAVFLPQLMGTLRREAPRIDLGTRHLLPMTGFEELDSRSIDLLIFPLDEIPARFHSTLLHPDGEFVIAARAGHPFFEAPTLRRYCEFQHLLVSITGDNSGYVDGLLAEKGLSRRVVLSVPTFMLALAVLADTDLLAAVPNTLVLSHGERFGLRSVKAPLPRRSWKLHAVVPKVALADPSIAWLFATVEQSARAHIRKLAPVRPKRATPASGSLLPDRS